MSGQNSHPNSLLPVCGGENTVILYYHIVWKVGAERKALVKPAALKDTQPLQEQSHHHHGGSYPSGRRPEQQG